MNLCKACEPFTGSTFPITFFAAFLEKIAFEASKSDLICKKQDFNE